MRATDAMHCSLGQNRTFCLRGISAAETPKEKPPYENERRRARPL
jgi:hypothetical protein